MHWTAWSCQSPWKPWRQSSQTWSSAWYKQVLWLLGLQKIERILLHELCCTKTFQKDIGMSKAVMNGEPGLGEILQLLAEYTLLLHLKEKDFIWDCFWLLLLEHSPLKTWGDLMVYLILLTKMLAMGLLLEDDREWDQCLREASQIQTGTALRSLFAVVILLSSFPVSPEIQGAYLWWLDCWSHAKLLVLTSS